MQVEKEIVCNNIGRRDKEFVGESEEVGNVDLVNNLEIKGNAKSNYFEIFQVFGVEKEAV